MKRIALILFASLLTFGAVSCKPEPLPDDGTENVTPEPENPEPENPEPGTPEPEDPESQPSVEAKPVVLWIDAEANFYRLRTKANIKGFLDTAQENGFNAFVVDVKPVQGDVLYNSSFLPKCTYLAGNTVERDWDYLQFFLETLPPKRRNFIAYQ